MLLLVVVGCCDDHGVHMVLNFSTHLAVVHLYLAELFTKSAHLVVALGVMGSQRSEPTG